MLHVEPEVYHVTVGHDVILALDAELAGRLSALLAAELNVVIVANDLGLDEAALEVRMDDASHPGAPSRP